AQDGQRKDPPRRVAPPGRIPQAADRRVLNPLHHELRAPLENLAAGSPNHDFIDGAGYTVGPVAGVMIIVAHDISARLDLGEVQLKVPLDEFIAMIAVDIDPGERSVGNLWRR